MINSLFLLGGSYNKDKKFSIIFALGWIIYMFINYDFSLGIIFPTINTIIYLTVVIGIGLIKSQKLNTVMSIISILIWSIITDIICFFVYHNMTAGQDIFAYVFQGILFNYKYIFVNVFAIFCINGIILTKNIIFKNIFKAKEIYNGI